MAFTVNEAITRLRRSTEWVTVDRIPLDFTCHHPQGLDRVGDTFYLTSVEILEETTRLENPDGGPDRTAGRGRGHLYEMSADGRQLGHWELGEGSAYHAGGLSYDGESLWVPVAEYRPDSKSVLYRIDPATSAISEMFRYPDHLGAVACEPDSELLHMATWGGRRLLVMTRSGELVREIPVRSDYIDFQDCLEMRDGLASWTGVAEYPDGSGGIFGLGGVALLDMNTGDIKHEAPVTVLSQKGRVITFNATHVETVGDRLRMYALPDDSVVPGDTCLLVLEAAI